MKQDYDKYVLVIGVTGSIGTKVCEFAHREGYSVIGTSRCETHHGGIEADHFLECDLADANQIVRLSERIRGITSSLRGIVNAAGVPGSPFSDFHYDSWIRTISVNLIGPVMIVWILRDLLAAKGGGSVVNVASVASYQPSRMVDYSASKAGLITATKSLAEQLGAMEIRLNCVSPGPIISTMTSGWSKEKLEQKAKMAVLQRIGTPSDVAEAVLFLLSDKARHITGTTIEVSGGFIKPMERIVDCDVAGLKPESNSNDIQEEPPH